MTDNEYFENTYTLIGEIGSGGGGIVYKARHNRLNVDVAVKKIRNEKRGILNDREEADILKRMKHSYLPRVYDFLELEKRTDDGRPVLDADGTVVTEVYTVIDFIEGHSLDYYTKQKICFPQKRVLKWAMQLAEALAYLHEQDPPVIHSDINPKNIMLTPEDNICLIDFNISLAFDNSLSTSTGTTGGYSPPEQYQPGRYYSRLQKERMKAAGERSPMRPDIDPDRTIPYDAADRTIPYGEHTETYQYHAAQEAPEPVDLSVSPLVERLLGRGVDKRSDIYSLGATLYQLLTGIKPGYDFDRIVPITQCDVEISEGFAAIIGKMMELDPEKRYQDGAALLDALRNIHELDSEYRRWKRSRRMKTALAACLFAVGAALTFAGTVMISNENNVSYNNLIMSAESALDAGEYETASALLDDAEVIFPEKIEAYRVEVLLLYEQEDYEGCIQYAEELLRNAPYTIEDDDSSALGEIYYILGNAYLETEDYGNALLYLESALMLDSGSSLYYRDYAIALALTGNVSQAEEMLQNAVILGLGEDSIYMVQGEIAYANQEYEEAVTDLLQTIASAESDTLRRRAVLLCDKAYRALGDVYLDAEILMLEQELNQYSDTYSAASIIERLADACVRKAEALGSGEEAEGYYRLALEEFLSLYDSGYVTSQLMENIAILYEDLDEFDEAEQLLLAMADRYPDSYVPYKRLAFLEADRQQEKENTERD